MSSSSGHSNHSLRSKGAPEPIDLITSEKATRRKAAARWEAEEEYALVLYLEQQIAAAGDGVNFAKKHFASVCLSEGRGQNNQQPTPNDNNKRVVVFLCGSGR